ncbi:MAG: ABC transporter permease [Ekhidna sp.]|nr:ABC transporter permease [Ekhidna sp.]
MVKHYIKASIRNFARHKVSFLINLIGLVGGLSSVLFIFTWVAHELSMDKFHADEDRIFRLVSGNAGNETLLNSSPRFASQLTEAIPEIELLAKSSWSSLQSSLIVEKEVFSAIGEFGSDDFFKIFTYPLLRGQGSTALAKPNAIVLSESMAIKLFNTLDVIGKRIEWRWFKHTEEVEITGVFQKLPATSSAQFDYVLSFDIFERRFKDRIDRGNRLGRTYIKLSEGADINLVNEKIAAFTKATYPDLTLKPAFLICYSGFYLNNFYEDGKPVGGRIATVRLFILIGALILIIACVNFMNLSTARASLRTKEIGVRKVIGAFKNSLIQQFLIESILICFIAGVISLIALFTLFPFFEQLVGKPIPLPVDIQFVFSFLGIVLLTGLISGSYPAFYLSGFRPLQVLKGHQTPSSGNQWFRKSLIIFQFSISFVLISSVLVIYYQMKYIQTKNVGYNKEHIISFLTNNMNREKQQSFLAEARKIQGIKKASGITHALFGGQIAGSNMTWRGKDPEQTTWFEWGYVDMDMLELLEISPIQGRFFSRDFGDEQSKIVINEATKNLMEMENPIGEKFTINGTPYEIIGVAENFHFQSLHNEIKPTFFRLNSGYSMKLAIRLDPTKTQEILRKLTDLYIAFNPGFPFEYVFHDQEQKRMYKTEQRTSMLSRYAAGLAVVISSLGLFGLISFFTERRAKEMSIRKVLGASSSALIAAISKDFTFPILLSSVVGIMVSVFALEYWLDGFAYRIELQWWYLAITIGIMLAIISITTSGKLIKTIAANPVETLKED